MSLTPRRTVRIPDYEWRAGHSKAQGEGDNLTNVIRRLLRGYLSGSTIEYLATPIDPAMGQPVSGITGRYNDVRRLYPARHWCLEERDVSGYRPAARR
ncbi:hypothetical protein [Mycobacteroides chelonae]|uniref:hypothetical protein n=1 Tax=Mycobacteroides chelonae TaxID=1774 RepID=UPI000618B39A|nr:hypothetical protein [Mycobacteroides chelonae]AKC38000.1 hypothetical protein GR01_04650 [Mycobacteroides chelonae]ANA97138.1 hypothetical protein BB28_04735 [Mycobacteroides chelonae CCUG 47445]